MKQCLSSNRPQLIMFEYLARTNLTETIEILEGIRYRVFRLGGEGADSCDSHRGPSAESLRVPY